MIELSNNPFERAQLKKLREVESDINSVGQQILLRPHMVTVELCEALKELIVERENIRISLQTK